MTLPTRALHRSTLPYYFGLVLLEAADLSLWITLIWHVTINSNSPATVGLLVATSGTTRVLTALVTSTLRLTAPAIQRLGFYANVLHALCALLLMFAVEYSLALWALIWVEAVRSALVSVQRTVREGWLQTLHKQSDNPKTVAYWVSTTQTIRILSPAFAATAIAVVGLSSLCFAIVVLNTMMALLGLILEGGNKGNHAYSNSGSFRFPPLAPEIQRLTSFMFLANAAMAPLAVYLPTIIHSNPTIGVVHFGIGEAMLGLGSMMGALLHRPSKSQRIPNLSSLGGVQALLFALLVVIDDYRLLCVVLALIGFSIGHLQSALLDIYLKHVPSEQYLRVRTLQLALSGIAFPLSAALAGGMAALFTPQAIPIYQAGALALGVSFLNVPSRRGRRNHQPKEQKPCGHIITVEEPSSIVTAESNATSTSPHASPPG